MCRTWDHHCRLLRLRPVVRRNVLHVVDGKILRCGVARWCGYCSNDLGRVKALFEVGFGGKVVGGFGGEAAAPSPRTVEVEPVSIVWPETAATSACVGEV